MSQLSSGELRDRLREGDVELGTFTDEELAVVSADAPEDRLVPLPRVDALDEDTRRVVVTAALRSLIARGLASLSTSDTEAPLSAANAELTLHGDLATIVQARGNPTTVAIVDRLRDGRYTHRYLFGLSDGVFLEERVDEAGDHAFLLRTLERAGDDLASFVDPEGRAGRSRRPIVREGERVPPQWAGVDEMLANSDTGTRLYAVRHGGEAQVETVEVGLAAGPNGVWALSGRRPTSTAPGRTQAQALSPAALRSLMRACLVLEPGGQPLAEDSE